MARFGTTFFTLAAVSAAGMFTGAAAGQFDMQQQNRTPTAANTVSMKMIASGDEIMPGETIHLAVEFTIKSGWHMYWKNPGAGAQAPQVNVDAPEGFTIGETRWPRPIVIGSPVGDMYSYKDSFALFVPVTAPKNLGDGQAAFTINVAYAVCDEDMCLFGKAEDRVNVGTTSSTVRTLEARPVPQIIARHRPRLPQPLDGNVGGDDGEAVLNDHQLRVTVPAADGREVTFLPHHSPGVTYGSADVQRRDDGYELVIDLEINEADFLDGPPDVGGIVMLGEKLDDPSFEFSLPLAP